MRTSLLLLLVVAPAHASELGARIEGDDLILSGPPSAKVRLLDSGEKQIGRGQLDANGTLVLVKQGAVDPMVRILEVDGRKMALSSLFPEVELMAVLPPTLSAGLPITPHVRVSARRDGAAASGISVSAALLCARDPPRVLGTMVSDGLGVATPTAETPLLVPADVRGSCRLVLRGAGAELGATVNVVRGARLVLSTDRPVYHAGDVIHLRGLALDVGTGQPLAKEKATVELRDPRGAVLARKELPTSDFGIASVDLTIPATFDSEAVIASFALGGERVEKRLEVGVYAPPKVLVTVRSPASVRLGETFAVRVDVARLDGGPVAGSRIEVSLLDGLGQVLFSAVRASDERGLDLAIRAPSAAAEMHLSARAETIGGEVGRVSQRIPIDDGKLRVFLIPESANVVPGIENGFWVVTTHPDGAPLGSEIQLDAGTQRSSGRTDAEGLAFVRLTVPAKTSKMTVSASSGSRRGEQSLLLDSKQVHGLLLRLDSAVAVAGSTVSLSVTAPGRSGVVIVDLAQGEHPVSAIAIPLVRGAGSAKLRLPDAASGTVRVHAWNADMLHPIVSDTRLLLVESARDLSITLTADKDTYAPRGQARISVAAVDARGAGAVAAIGLTAVDEGLRALGLEQPGLERALARLGTAWDKPAAVVPDWVARALYVAHQNRRLAVLASAMEPELELSAPRETGPGRIEAARGAFQAGITRRAARIAEAINRWYREHPRKLKIDVDVATLLAARLVTPEDVADPWDQPLNMEIRRDAGCCESEIAIASAGVDGRRGSGDDITATAAVVIGPRQCACGYGFGGRSARGVGFGGGGAAFGTGAVWGPSHRVPLRTDFPETLFVAPELITDADGKATVTIPLADSLTRWLVQARAVSLRGGLGSAETVLQVTLPFSADVSLPPSLTRLDQIEVPIGLTNNTDAARTVSVRATASGALEGGVERSVIVPAQGSASIPLMLTAARIGEGAIEILAGEDAIRRTLQVEADGVPVEIVRSGAVASGSPSTVALDVPSGGIPGTRKLTLRLYPSAVGAVVEGLESLLQMPSGCFEQTSATTYPNALVLEYLQKTNRASPELAEKARALLTAGWKRLVSYEVQGGGFSWFGEAPANKLLSAFGVMEFDRIAAVMPIDRAIAKRTRAWLLAQRKPDGSFAPDAAYLHADSWGRLQSASLAVTAYIAWALGGADAGAELTPTLAWIRAHESEAQDPYVMALVALALGRSDSRARLASKANVDGEAALWPTAMTTATYAGGKTASLETSGLSAIAMLAGNDQLALSQKAITGLLAERSAGAGWGSTQATTLALSALLDSEAKNSVPAKGSVRVRLDGAEGGTIAVQPEDFDVVRTVALDSAPGHHALQLALEGEGRLSWQLAATRNVPAEEAPRDPSGLLELVVTPDRTTLAIGETLQVSVRLTAKAVVRMPTITIGLPAGVELDPTRFAAAKVARHEVLGRRVVLYLERLGAGEVFETTLPLTARRAGKVAPGLASAWPYYEPERIVRIEQPRLTILAAAASL